MQINSMLCDKVLRYPSLKLLNADKQIEGKFFLCSPNNKKKIHLKGRPAIYGSKKADHGPQNPWFESGLGPFISLSIPFLSSHHSL